MTAEDLLNTLTQALVDTKAQDVKTYDVRGKSGLTDYFVVATGAAAPHLKALVKAMPKPLKLSAPLSNPLFILISRR